MKDIPVSGDMGLSVYQNISHISSVPVSSWNIFTQLLVMSHVSLAQGDGQWIKTNI